MKNLKKQFCRHQTLFFYIVSLFFGSSTAFCQSSGGWVWKDIGWNSKQSPSNASITTTNSMADMSVSVVTSALPGKTRTASAFVTASNKRVFHWKLCNPCPNPPTSKSISASLSGNSAVNVFATGANSASANAAAATTLTYSDDYTVGGDLGSKSVTVGSARFLTAPPTDSGSGSFALLNALNSKLKCSVSIVVQHDLDVNVSASYPALTSATPVAKAQIQAIGTVPY